jgi:hypothetical protein
MGSFTFNSTDLLIGVESCLHILFAFAVIVQILACANMGKDYKLLKLFQIFIQLDWYK